jgi:hypothetical protein
VTKLERSNRPWLKNVCITGPPQQQHKNHHYIKMQDFIRHPMPTGQSEMTFERTAMLLCLTRSRMHLSAPLHMFDRRKEERRTDVSLGNTRDTYPTL